MQYEALDGKAGTTDMRAVRETFGGMQFIDLNEGLAVETARMQDELMDDGERMAARDLLVAASARSTCIDEHRARRSITGLASRDGPAFTRNGCNGGV